MGSRRTETLETVFGIRKRKSGRILKNGTEVNNRMAKEAIRNGFSLVTEDRRQSGIFASLDITFNSTIANQPNYSKMGILDKKRIAKDTDWVIEKLHVKTASEKTKIGTLSGGNQQKVILGRWLLTDSHIMMLDEPTRGIDVGAKYEIYQLVNEYAAKGSGILFISSEMPELQEEILRLAAKYL